MSYDIHIITRLRDRQNKYKTMALPRRRPDRIGRRRLQRAKYLNVYDLAQLADGSTVSYRSASALDTGAGTWKYGVGGPPQDKGGIFNTTVGGATEFDLGIPLTNLWDDWLLANYPDPTTYASTFKNITQHLSDYQVSFATAYDSDSSGVVLPSDVTSIRGSGSDSISWRFNSPFQSPYVCSPLQYSAFLTIKITSGASYASSPVTLTVDSSIDVFISPGLSASWGVVRTANGPGSSPYLPQTWKVALRMAQPIPRSYVSDSDWNTFLSAGTFTSSLKTSLVANMINNGHTVLTFQCDASDWDPVFSQDIIPSGKITTGTDGFADTRSASDGIQQVRAQGTTVGQLIAVVRKHVGSGFEYYYIWSDSTFSSGTGFVFQLD